MQDTTVYVSYNNESHFVTMSCVDNNVTSDAQRIAFAWYQLIVMFLFPVVVIVYCYAVVTRVLWVSTKQHALMTQSTARPTADTGSAAGLLLLTTYRRVATGTVKWGWVREGTFILRTIVVFMIAPYVIGQTIIFSSCSFFLSFYLSFFFFLA